MSYLRLRVSDLQGERWWGTNLSCAHVVDVRICCRVYRFTAVRGHSRCKGTIGQWFDFSCDQFNRFTFKFMSKIFHFPTHPALRASHDIFFAALQRIQALHWWTLQISDNFGPGISSPFWMPLIFYQVSWCLVFFYAPGSRPGVLERDNNSIRTMHMHLSIAKLTFLTLCIRFRSWPTQSQNDDAETWAHSAKKVRVADLRPSDVHFSHVDFCTVGFFVLGMFTLFTFARVSECVANCVLYIDEYDDTNWYYIVVPFEFKRSSHDRWFVTL